MLQRLTLKTYAIPVTMVAHRNAHLVALTLITTTVYHFTIRLWVTKNIVLILMIVLVFGKIIRLKLSLWICEGSDFLHQKNTLLKEYPVKASNWNIWIYTGVQCSYGCYLCAFSFDIACLSICSEFSQVQRRNVIWWWWCFFSNKISCQS